MMWIQRSVRVHELSLKVREATGLKRTRHDPPVVMGVCGGSGSGKTTFCKQFVQLFGADQVIHLKQDDYYRDLKHLPLEQREQVNFDHPDSVEFELLIEHLESLSCGHQIAIPKYDFSTHTRIDVEEIVSPRPVVLIEGILLFSQQALMQKLDLKVFIDTPEDVRFDRRLRRDVRERGRSRDSVLAQLSQTVQPMHQTYVEPAKTIADRVISGEFPFDPYLYDLCGQLVLLKRALRQGFS